MTQAILYGSNLDVGQPDDPSLPATETSAPQNPLNFSFPPEVDGTSLMTGAEQLSKSILESGDAWLYWRSKPFHTLTVNL